MDDTGWMAIKNPEAIRYLPGGKYYCAAPPHIVDGIMKTPHNPNGFRLPPGLEWLISCNDKGTAPYAAKRVFAQH